MNHKQAINIVLIVLLLMAAAGCSSGGTNLGTNPTNPRLLLEAQDIGGTARLVSIGGPQTATFPALTYYVFGSNESLGNRSGVPLQSQRLDEQVVGTLALGDPDVDVDLTPWNGYQHIYLRAIVVQPNVIWEIEPGVSYVFRGN